MKYWLLASLVASLMMLNEATWASPAITALPMSLTSVQVKFTGTSYPAGTSLTYQIRHWPDNAMLSQGQIAANQVTYDSVGYASFTISGLSPQPWTLLDPQLYTISVYGNTGALLGSVRFGFRTIAVSGRRICLNGRPTFLRSVPINPPGRDLPTATGNDPEFARGYLRLLKSAGVNLVRTSGSSVTSDSDWLNACDEIGMLASQGNYGVPPGASSGTPPSAEAYKPIYRDILLPLANHPSVVIYYLTNEVSYAVYGPFLTAIHDSIVQVDPTRLIIGNAGFGKGQGGELYDMHPYLGWYHDNATDWYDFKDYIASADAANKPLTISECVGAYTSDAGVFQSMSKQMSNRFRWTGAVQDQRAAALDYQAEVVRQVVEIGRRMRSNGTGIASIMPFTYFFGWASAYSVDDLIIKPAFEVLKTVFQPVLISPECWKRNIYAGDSLQIKLYVCNDDDTGRDLGASVATVGVLRPDGTAIAGTVAQMPAVPYYTNASASVTIPIPSNTPRGDYTVKCALIENGVQISKNSFEITVAPRSWPSAAGVSVKLYDPSATTGSALQRLGVSYTTVSSLSSLPTNGVLVIGENAFNTSRPSLTETLAFLNRGGRILCMRQSGWNDDWLPANFTQSARSRLTYIHPIGDNDAIFEGLRDRDFRYWNSCSTYSNGGSTVEPVLDLLWPVTNADLANCRVWASSERLLSGAAILELYYGQGSVIMSQFRNAERVDDDPIAAKLLANLIKYAASPKHPGLVDLSKPVKWDVSAFRTGVFVSKTQGFFPHSATYSHKDAAKGRLGDDHSIDGFTMIGTYDFDGNGYLVPIPDPAADGWGVFYGRLSRPATKFDVTARNVSSTAALIKLKIDGVDIGTSISFSGGQTRTVEWNISHGVGPVKVELRGDQDLVITQTEFK